nr:ZIP family metal transporter [Flavobacterium sp. xlx-221]
MITYLLPFISVVLGYLVAVLVKPKNKKVIKLLLAFSGAFLLTMTVSHLLPEVYEHVLSASIHHDHAHDSHDHDHSAMKTIGLFIMLGIVFQIVLEYFSKGAEHGHVHVHEKITSLPWLLFGSLCLHALFEGMPISQHDHLAWGIAVHHFPIAIILTLFFLQAQLSKKMIFLFMIVFAFMTPLGTYLSNSLPFLVDYYAQISAFVIGILFHISSTIIFESSEGHKFNSAKLLAIILGIALGFWV